MRDGGRVEGMNRGKRVREATRRGRCETRRRKQVLRVVCCPRHSGSHFVSPFVTRFVHPVTISGSLSPILLARLRLTIRRRVKGAG